MADVPIPTAYRVYTGNGPDGPTINFQLVGTPYTATFASPFFSNVQPIDETVVIKGQD